MYSSKACAVYFRGQKAYERCMKELRKKWKSYGRVAGKISLKQTSEEERRAVGGILGKVFYEETIQFSFLEFEQGLQKTRFAPVDVKELLEEYFGEPLMTTQEQQKKKQEKKEQFFERLYRCFELYDRKGQPVYRWLRAMNVERKYGYQLLMREFGKKEAEAETLVKNVGNAIMKLQEMKDIDEECQLAVFAAAISGNPHYFDRDTAAGLLLVHGICYCEDVEVPQNAHQWRELLTRASIVPDNVSSMVHAYGLRLQTEEGWHPAYDAFCRRKESYVITMEQMKGITGVQALGEGVYVVENEMVFSYLLHNLKKQNYTLLCTSGQPRFVAQVLISYILASGTEIYYNGDIDPDGIRIADRLWKKFGEHFHIWRMGPLDYESSLSKEDIGDIGKAKITAISHPVLKKTAKYMEEKQLTAYQENMLKELMKDMEADHLPCSFLEDTW